MTVTVNNPVSKVYSIWSAVVENKVGKGNYLPQIDDLGDLVVSGDGITPMTPPDYTLKKIIDSQKSKVARYGISKIGGSE